MNAWFKKMKRVVDLVGELFFSVLLFPFTFLYYTRPGWTRLIGLLVFLLPSFFVWGSIYLYLLHSFLLSVGFRPENGGVLGTLSADPHVHFGTGFFVCFFPLMLYYLYVVRTDRFDAERVRAYFTESLSEEGGQESAREVFRSDPKRWKRNAVFFLAASAGSFLIVLVPILFAFIADGEGSDMRLGDAFSVAAVLGITLGMALAWLIDTRYAIALRKEREKEEER
jgi:hypothetical protein